MTGGLVNRSSCTVTWPCCGQRAVRRMSSMVLFVGRRGRGRGRDPPGVQCVDRLALEVVGGGHHRAPADSATLAAVGVLHVVTVLQGPPFGGQPVELGSVIAHRSRPSVPSASSASVGVCSSRRLMLLLPSLLLALSLRRKFRIVLLKALSLTTTWREHVEWNQCCLGNTIFCNDGCFSFKEGQVYIMTYVSSEIV